MWMSGLLAKRKSTDLKRHIELKNEQDSLLLGQAVAAAVRESELPLMILYLRGDLGAGKTTLSRGILRSFGHDGAVKSPTYTLVEPYELAKINIYHFDLYRLGDPEELEFLGIRDYFEVASGQNPVVNLIEWPEKGEGMLPKPDMVIDLSVVGVGRRACIEVFNDGLANILGMKLEASFPNGVSDAL